MTGAPPGDSLQTDAQASRDESPLPLRHALALGLLHGPAELLPISSSGHVTLVPWLAGWPYERLDRRLRKSFEVALHAGTAAGLVLSQVSSRLNRDRRNRGRLDEQGVSAVADSGRDRLRRLTFLAASSGPPALAGYALHGPVERRLGTPRTIAAGLIAGSVAIALAEGRARRRGARRPAGQAGLRDGLALGAAQAVALVPGVSRSGATFAAARARGFAARDAERLSLTAGLPVLGGATLLQGSKALTGDLPQGMRTAFALGAAGAFASTLLTPTLLDSERRSKAALGACLYRIALAAVVIERSLTQAAGTGGILKAFRAPP